MKKDEKLEFLILYHYKEYAKTKDRIEKELSEQQGICICGKIATGLHEQNCKKFQNKILSETIKELNHLLPLKKNKKETDFSWNETIQDLWS